MNFDISIPKGSKLQSGGGRGGDLVAACTEGDVRGAPIGPPIGPV